jgi:hypothetical protein
MRWISEKEASPLDVVSFGALIADEEAAVLRDIVRPAAEFDYLSEYGYSGSATACGIGMFMKRFPGKTLLHINRDQRGNYAVIELAQF